MKRKLPECAYIAYFQANTNTYGPLDKIKKMIAPFFKTKKMLRELPLLQDLIV